jgi:hypothetical protein
LPTFANGGSTQLVPLEIVGERAQLLATFARVERNPVFSLGVSQHMHELSNLWEFELNWSSK